MLKKICGDHALKNVIIVTTMWQLVEPRVGEKRQTELEGNDLFFKSVKTAGGQFARHNNTPQSAENIIRPLLHKSHSPLPLHIQKELVDEEVNIKQTSAAVQLDRDKKDQIEQFKREREETMKEMQEAISGVVKNHEELEKEVEEKDRLILKLENGRKMLEAEYQKQRKAFEESLQGMDSETKRGQSEKPRFLATLGNKMRLFRKKGTKASPQ